MLTSWTLLLIYRPCITCLFIKSIILKTITTTTNNSNSNSSSSKVTTYIISSCWSNKVISLLLKEEEEVRKTFQSWLALKLIAIANKILTSSEFVRKRIMTKSHCSVVWARFGRRMLLNLAHLLLIIKILMRALWFLPSKQLFPILHMTGPTASPPSNMLRLRIKPTISKAKSNLPLKSDNHHRDISKKPRSLIVIITLAIRHLTKLRCPQSSSTMNSRSISKTARTTTMAMLLRHQDMGEFLILNFSSNIVKLASKFREDLGGVHLPASLKKRTVLLMQEATKNSFTSSDE